MAFSKLAPLKHHHDMSSKFFGNSRQKNSPGKKGGKHKMTNKNNKQKSSGVRKVGRGG